MSKKLMLLAAGALTALAFAALPVVASAGEFSADCETGANCAATIAGGKRNSLTPLAKESAVRPRRYRHGDQRHLDRNRKNQFHGMRREHYALPLLLHQHGNRRENRNELAGLPSHLSEPSKGTPGILFDRCECDIHLRRIREKNSDRQRNRAHHNPNCGTFQASHTLKFEAASNGVQKYMTITTTGTKFDLESNNDAGGAYSTSSQAGEGTISYTGGNKVKLTC